MPFHHIFSGLAGETPELVARDLDTPQGVNDAIRAQLHDGPSAIRVVTSDVQFAQAWDKFRAENPAEAGAASDSSAPGAAPSYSDVLGTWAEVTDEFIKE